MPMPDPAQQSSLPVSEWMQGYDAALKTMGNAQQKAVANALCAKISDVLDDNPECGVHHDHLMHLMYPSLIEYGPVTEAKAEWVPGLTLGFEVIRVYR